MREMLPIEKSLASAHPDLVLSYRLILQSYIAHGTPPTYVPKSVMQKLAKLQLILLSADENTILGAYPFRTSGTRHRLIIGRTIVGSMCAFDPLGVSHMIHMPVRIVSECAVTGQPIMIDIHGVRVVSTSPQSEIRVGMDWSAACCEIPAYGICEEAIYLIGPDIAKQWASQGTQREIYTLGDLTKCSATFFAHQLYSGTDIPEDSELWRVDSCSC